MRSERGRGGGSPHARQTRSETFPASFCRECFAESSWQCQNMILGKSSRIQIHGEAVNFPWKGYSRFLPLIFSRGENREFSFLWVVGSPPGRKSLNPEQKKIVIFTKFSPLEAPGDEGSKGAEAGGLAPILDTWN